MDAKATRCGVAAGKRSPLVCGGRLPASPAYLRVFIAIQLLTMLSAAPAGAQAVRGGLAVSRDAPREVAGRVVDYETGRPVVGARVRLSGEERITDRAGGFSFSGVAPGDQTLEVEHLGYGTQREALEVPAEGEARYEVRLPATALELEGVVVTAISKRERARRAGITNSRILTRGEIEPFEDRGSHVGDLLRRGVPGVRVREKTGELCVEIGRGGTRRGGISGRSCGSVLVVVDGVPVAYPERYLPSLPIREIESVQLLNPVEAGMLYGSRAGRGVLLIYTRGNGPHRTRH